MNPLRALIFSLCRIPPAVMLVAVVGLAVVVSVIVTDHLTKKERQYRDEINRIEAGNKAKGHVVYLTRDIAEGQTIPADAIEEREVAQSKIPQDAVLSVVQASGRRAKYSLPMGQMLSQHDLAADLSPSAFESQLRPGMRAVTIPVDANSGVAGFVAPGSRVDIMAMAGAGAETRVAAVLSDVEVIAVGQTYQRSPGTGGATPVNSVTVAVSPDDGRKLIKAIAASKLYLALRSERDRSPVATVDAASLYVKPPSGSPARSQYEFVLPPPPSDAPSRTASVSRQSVKLPPPGHDVEVWTGAKKDTVSFVRPREPAE